MYLSMAGGRGFLLVLLTHQYSDSKPPSCSVSTFTLVIIVEITVASAFRNHLADDVIYELSNMGLFSYY